MSKSNVQYSSSISDGQVQCFMSKSNVPVQCLSQIFNVCVQSFVLLSNVSNSFLGANSHCTKTNFHVKFQFCDVDFTYLISCFNFNFTFFFQTPINVIIPASSFGLFISFYFFHSLFLWALLGSMMAVRVTPSFSHYHLQDYTCIIFPDPCLASSVPHVDHEDMPYLRLPFLVFLQHLIKWSVHFSLHI